MVNFLVMVIMVVWKIIILENKAQSRFFMTIWFYEHLLNHCHWVWVRLLDDAPQDAIHKCLTRIFDIGMGDSMRCYMKAKGEW